MKRKGVRATGVSVLSLAVAGCGIQDPAPFDPVELQRADRMQARQTPQVALDPLPTTLQSLPPSTRPATRPGTPAGAVQPGNNEPTVRITLQELVHRSVANSREVRVAGYDPAIAETKILEAQARFDPILFTNLKYQHQDQQTAGQEILDPTNPNRVELLNVERGDIYTLEPGIKQVLPSGGEISLSYQIQESEFSPRTFVSNPYWENTVKLQLTQPLLRDYGYGVNQARITISRYDQKISLLDFRKTLEENIAEIEKDYWQLVQAEQEVRIQEELLERTHETADILIKRFVAGGGDVTRVQTAQATASVRAREAVLVRARTRMADISDDLKRRMNDPEFPVAGEVVILAADAPVTIPIEFELKDQVDTAMESRLELSQQQQRIASADVATMVAKKGLLPKVDLQVSLGLQGLDDSEGTALYNQLGQSTHPSYSLGLQIEVPIGNREANAVYRRTRLQQAQAIEQYSFLVEQVSQEVKTSLRDVNTSWMEISIRRQARFAAGDSLRAIEQKEAGGEALTPTFVQLKLDSQERLADAEREEAAAVSNYNTAISRLERAKGTLLRYNNVSLEETAVRH